jgi:hypothetical protein
VRLSARHRIDALMGGNILHSVNTVVSSRVFFGCNANWVGEQRCDFLLLAIRHSVMALRSIWNRCNFLSLSLSLSLMDHDTSESL